uniref:Uncharacterized protein n=1 Tax=viral metagenome TaxID=1070528 RepID=A0A6C0ERZ3_9ZZZZ
MENTNNISTSILQSSDTYSLGESLTPTNSGNSFVDGIKNISITTWVIIILIFAFLGFNIFVYLAKGTQDITGFFGPLLQKILGYTASVTGQVVDVSAEGAKTVVNTTADVATSGLSEIQNVAQGNSSLKSQPVQNTIQQPDLLANNTLNKSLNSSQSKLNNQEQDYEASEASSSLHLSGGKSGWCYIGEERGIRTCAQVGDNDMCMSGDIFPSQEICVNPSLRS